MKVELAKNRIYQYQSLSEPISRRSAFQPEKVYVNILSFADNIAKCKVCLVIEQPKGNTFKRNKIVYIPISHLVEPDLYPKFSKDPKKWLHLSNQPVMDSAMEIMSELSPTLHGELVTATTVDRRDLKVGQKWANTATEISLEKMWDSFFIVKDKFGDYQKYSREELAEKLTNQKFRLLKSFDLPALIKAVTVLLSPFMGAWALGLLTKALPSLVTRSEK